MGRRMRGIVLLMLVLLAAMTVSGLQTKQVRGIPMLAPVPGAPRIGQCLLQTPPGPGDQGQSYRLGGCAAAHYGEVAEVIPDGTAEPASVGHNTGPAWTCQNEAKYLGWTPAVPATAEVSWRSIDINAIRMEPTRLQRAFGQRWIVCVLTPTPATVSYTGSVRGVLATGRLPSSFARCGSTDDPTSVLPPAPCGLPHRYETFGTASLSADFRDQQVLDADCVRIVQAATRRPDPTAERALTIRAVVSHQNPDFLTQPGFAEAGAPADRPAGLPVEATCTVGVTGSRLLTGTLFGIGAGALPWS